MRLTIKLVHEFNIKSKAKPTLISYLPCDLVKTYLCAADYQYQQLPVPFPPYFCSWFYGPSTTLNTTWWKKKGCSLEEGHWTNMRTVGMFTQGWVTIVKVNLQDSSKVGVASMEVFNVNLNIPRTCLILHFPWICIKPKFMKLLKYPFIFYLKALKGLDNLVPCRICAIPYGIHKLYVSYTTFRPLSNKVMFVWLNGTFLGIETWSSVLLSCSIGLNTVMALAS